MDVFKLRHNLIDDYKSYVKSFINIKDKRIEEYVQENFEQGILWPELLIQLNPSFESGGEKNINLRFYKSDGMLHIQEWQDFDVKGKINKISVI